jgi:hypothetical protein
MADVKEDDVDIVISEDGADDEDEDEMMMDGNPLEDFLVSDEGDNVANVIAKGLERVCQQMDVQNKILVKLYTILAKTSSSSSKA